MMKHIFGSLGAFLLLSACAAYPVYVEVDTSNEEPLFVQLVPLEALTSAAETVPIVPNEAQTDGDQSLEVSFAGYPVINLLDFTGEILTVRSYKEWNPEQSLSCPSLHFYPARSTPEGGPDGADFQHQQIELRCLNPGTDLFDLENIGNGFVEVSIAVEGSLKSYTYSSLQQMALDSKKVAVTTDGASVIRMYVYVTDLLERHLGPPKVSLDPWSSKNYRRKYEAEMVLLQQERMPGLDNVDLERYRNYGADPSSEKVGGVVPQQSVTAPINLHTTAREGSGLMPSCSTGILVISGWDLSSLPANMKQTVYDAQDDGRRHFVSGSSFSHIHNDELIIMLKAETIRRTTRRPSVRISIINPNGTEGEVHNTLMGSDGMVYARFSPKELPNGSMVRVVVANDQFASPSINPESGLRELRVVSWQGRCDVYAHVVING